MAQLNQGKLAMRKTLAIAALAVLTVASSMIASTSQADAHFRRWGPALGIGLAGAFVAGAVIANSGPYERCGWAYRYDRFGNPIGRSWVCVPY
jgi:hypothetical protein